ncbi:glycosyltransferase family 2 protein [Blastopirellula marina]|uniref:Glycosyltransferase family 2 protein n=1 Tax=Blastopirellula marina TaxID=124 RepID=A0A2S8GNG9_9BACT|nr:glycosyltransferase family 2 protein [Blastopirellula marina]
MLRYNIELNDGLACRDRSEQETQETRIAVVIVNYCTPELTLQCLSSLANGRSDTTRLTVFVVDNASPDNSGARLQVEAMQPSYQGWVQVILAPSNGGFAYGNNIGISKALDSPDEDSPDALWLLNSDTYLREGALEEVAAAIRSDASTGIWGTRLEWPDSEPQLSCFRFHRISTELVSVAQTEPITWLFASAEVPIHKSLANSSVEVEWVSFASVVLRREVVDAIGLMDEGYFMYFEDVDYCRTAVANGFKVRYLPNARTVHLRGGSSPVKSLSVALKRRPRYYYAARTRYYAKWYGRFWGPLVANACWYLGRTVWFFRQLFDRSKLGRCQAEWRDIWVNFSAPLE